MHIFSLFSRTVFGTAVKCDAVACDATKCDATKCETTKCDTAKCDTAKCDTAKCETTECDTTKCDTTKCDAPRNPLDENNGDEMMKEDSEVDDRPPINARLRAKSNTAISSWTKKTNDFSDVGDDFVLPSGSVKLGAKYFKKYCIQCHSIYPDNRITYAGQYLTGPTMFNVCGRASGQEEMFNPSNPYRVEGVLWTDAALMNYMKNPRRMVGGPIQMNFQGIKDLQIRVDIIHYLYTLDWSNDKLVNPAPRPVGGFARLWNMMRGGPKEESWHKVKVEDVEERK